MTLTQSPAVLHSYPYILLVAKKRREGWGERGALESSDQPKGRQRWQQLSTSTQQQCLRPGQQKKILWQFFLLQRLLVCSSLIYISLTGSAWSKCSRALTWGSLQVLIQGLREDRDIRLFRLLLSLQHRDNRLLLIFIFFSLEKSLPQWGPTTCLLHLWEVSTCTCAESKFKFQVPFWLYFQMKVTLLYTLAEGMLYLPV